MQRATATCEVARSRPSRFPFPVCRSRGPTFDARVPFPYSPPVGFLSRKSFGAALVALSVTVPAANGRAQAPVLPPAAGDTIDFARDIQPILQRSCVRCHARGRARGGFSIETRERLLQGGDSGPAVEPGSSAESELIRLVTSLDPEVMMPQKGSRLTSRQVGLLRAWIDQGLPWDPAISFARTAPRNLTPRRPDVPPADASLRHPVDRLLAPYLESHEPGPLELVDDRRFARRVYLDLVGMLPTPAELDAFLADERTDRRTRLVDALLADNRRYAEHWLSFWNDLLRNDYRGTGYIDGGRTQISTWLYAALANNLAYDRFVAALVNPSPATAGFTKGIVWRGVVNASQTPQMQAAQNISQVFMGVNLKCASCHDSFINDWRLADAYGLASIYADGPLEMVECDRPTGQTAAAKLLYEELGAIDANAPRRERIAQLADALISSRNGRLSRTIVNRLWARFMGRGLVEPVDDMEQPAWHPDLLDWLAEDLVANKYDLKKTIARIVTSRAYQAVAVDLPERVENYVFRGPAIRRLTAEQFSDAVGQLTGVWPEQPAGEFEFTFVDADAVPRAGEIRASLVAADPLLTALGRPNREQVVTERASAATTLQALQLLNGETLARRLAQGAGRLAATHRSSTELVDQLYVRALGRAPTAEERRLCEEMLGPSPSAEGIEDLLWSLVMLPEFQLID